MKPWTKAHDAHCGPAMVMATRLKEPRCAAIPAGVVAAMAWGGKRIVLEGN
jgi:hypothetical protein